MGKSMGKSPHTRYLIDGDGDGEIAPYAILNRWGNLWDGDGEWENWFNPSGDSIRDT